MAKVITSKEEFESQCAAYGCSFPLATTTDALGTPLKIGMCTVPNRIVYQPMEGCDGEPNGAPGERTIAKYMNFAKSGAGMIWLEATAVCDEGKANPRQLRLTDATKDAFTKLVSDMKRVARETCGYEPILILQLTHSGRQSKPNGTPAQLVAYHNAIFEENTYIADEQIVSDTYLDCLQDRFVSAARLAMECGFDGVDIKSCHGYLLGELMSGYTRPGKYGGSFENRTRFLREVTHRVRQILPAGKLLCSRMSAYDGFPYPWGFGVKTDGSVTPDWTEACRLIQALEVEGVDLINITMGNPYVNPHVNRPFALGAYTPDETPIAGVERILSGTVYIKTRCPKMPIVTSGFSFLGVESPYVAAGYVEAGKADLVGFGRMTLAYPDFAADVLSGQFKNNQICMACSKCTQLMRAGGIAGCVVRNPFYTQEYLTMKKEGKIK